MLGAGLALSCWRPRVPSADSLYPGTGGGGGGAPQAGLHTPGAGEGAPSGLPRARLLPCAVPITPPCCHPFPRPVTLPWGWRGRGSGTDPAGAGCSEAGRGGRSHWWPLSDKVLGCVWRSHLPSWIWAPSRARSSPHRRGGEAVGAPQGRSTLLWFGLPSHGVGAVGPPRCPNSPQRAITLSSSSSSSLQSRGRPRPRRAPVPGTPRARR